MNGKIARQNLKDLLESVNFLLDATSVLETGDSKIEVSMSRLAELDRQVKARQDALREASSLYESKKEEAKKSYDADMASLSGKISALQQELQGLNQQIAEAKSRVQTEIKQETGRLNAEKKAMIAGLDNEIEAKQKRLDQINAGIEEQRRRFA